MPVLKIQHWYNSLRQEVVPCLQTVESADIQKSVLLSILANRSTNYWRSLYLAITIAIFRGNNVATQETAHCMTRLQHFLVHGCILDLQELSLKSGSGRNLGRIQYTHSFLVWTHTAKKYLYTQASNKCACIMTPWFYLDINECVLDTDNDCDENAECKNTVGGFNCTCDPGYMGNGTMCAGMTEDVTFSYTQEAYIL